MTSRPPGPPDPPFIPGHLGAPSYGECARMAFMLGLVEVADVKLPPAVAFHIGAWDRRLRAWVRAEVERGNLDKLVESVTLP